MKRISGRGGGGNITRIIALVIAGVLLIGIVFAGIFPLIANGETEYSFELNAFDAGVAVTQRITYTNDTGGKLDSALFSLPANAYRRSATAPIDPDAFQDAYPEVFTPGGVEFYAVLVNGKNSDFGLSGAGETNLRVACDLAPGETCEFTFLYDVVPPTGRLPFGANNTELRLTSFYPVMGVYDPDERMFYQYPSSANRSMTFADEADFSAELRVEKSFTIAAPGLIQRLDSEDGFRVELKSARDLSIIVKKKATERTGQSAAGNEIRISAPDWLSARRSLTYAARALNFCMEKFGEYPYESLAIASADVLSADVHSGMIILPNELFRFRNRYALERAIANGVARQYFGLLCQNNPELAPWLDDSVCSYAELCYVESIYGKKAFLAALNEAVLPSFNTLIPDDAYVDREASYFASGLEYDLVIKGRGAAVMHEMRGLLGDDAFFDALRHYVDNTRGGVATIDDMIGAFNAASERDVRYFLTDMLKTIGEYAKQNPDQYGG